MGNTSTNEEQDESGWLCKSAPVNNDFGQVKKKTSKLRTANNDVVVERVPISCQDQYN